MKRVLRRPGNGGKLGEIIDSGRSERVSGGDNKDAVFESPFKRIRSTLEHRQSMNSTDSSYPDDWPPYLATSVELGTCGDLLPTGYHRLLFEKLNSKQFEQFCWWLLQKKHLLVGCQILGGSGTSQGGIDLFAFDRLELGKLIVFECKCWSELSSGELDESVERFLNGPWVSEASRFVLIIAQPELGKLREKWLKARKRILDAGVHAEVWTGTNLTYEVQPFPDIVSKFFGNTAADAFCNEWMQRVGFHERLHKALVDHRPEVVKVAEDFVNNMSLGDELETRTHYGTMWSITRPWVFLNAILPGERSYPGSASVILRKQDAEGATVVLSQKWLFGNFLGCVNSPLRSQYRPFLVGELPGSTPEKFVVDFENCRFTLPENGVRELAYVSDELSKVFLPALRELEEKWGAQYFPFVGKGSVAVAVCTMPRWLWNNLLRFAEDHDYDNGVTDWHIFEATRTHLRPHTKNPHPHYDQGCHGIFHARDDIEGLVYGDNVLIVWSPSHMIVSEIGVRKWWPCDYVFNWIQNQLLPAVGDWAFEKSKKWSLFHRSRKAKFNDWWREHAKVIDTRILPLAEGKRYRAIGLRETVGRLQRFFSGYGDNQKIYLSAEKIKGLYLALITVLGHGRGHAGYIAGNLQLDRPCQTHAEIIEELLARVKSEQFNASSAVMDFMLRAILAALGQEVGWLPEPEAEKVFCALLPLMEFHDQRMLIRRHSRWN